VVLRRDDWLDLARKVDWTPRYVDERELFPEEISGRPWLPHEAWRNWNEVYRTTYREYVANQREKDAAVLGVRAALSKPHSSTTSTQGGFSWSSSTTLRLPWRNTPPR
jgi:toluene monooxygenase system protein A